MRLAMLDVDGTLKHEADWMPAARELMQALDAAGIAVALCSGRVIESLQTTAAECPEVSLLAGAGGSLVQERTADGWRNVGERCLSRDVVTRAAEGTRRLGMELWAYTGTQWLVRERSERVRHDEDFTHAHATMGDPAGRDDVIKLLTFCETPEQDEFRRELAAIPGVGVASSYPGYWDVLPAVSLETKGGDLLTETLGCAWEEALAAGDGSNDLGMLSHAGLAYLLAPRSGDELAPAQAGQERVEVGAIADVLADLRRRGILA